MYRLINVATDSRFSFQRSRAQALQMEPLVCGKRLRLGQSIQVTDAQFESDKTRIELAKNHGVLDYKRLSADSTSGPAPLPEAPTPTEPTADTSSAEASAPTETASPAAPPPPPSGGQPQNRNPPPPKNKK